MAVSKKKRFDVLKRDGFTCQYCGRRTPDVLLEVDHIIPKSKGGPDTIDNLVTACFDCNRGKGATELDCVPDALAQKIKVIEEKRKQYLQYKRLIKKQEKLLKDELNEVDAIYNSYFNGYVLSDNFKKKSVGRFIKAIGLEDVKDAMDKACMKCDSDQAIKYFCGICWNIIKDKDE